MKGHCRRFYVGDAGGAGSFYVALKGERPSSVMNHLGESPLSGGAITVQRIIVRGDI